MYVGQGRPDKLYLITNYKRKKKGRYNMSKNNKGVMDNNSMVARGIITVTSDKQSEDFKTDSPRKTVYFKAQNEVEEKKLEDFGLTKYTVQEGTPDEQDLFMIKTSETIKIGKYNKRSGVAQTRENGVDNPNFTSDDNVVAIALFKGNKSGNDFVRITAIHGIVKDIEAVDPFADMDLSDIEVDELEARGITAE